MSNNGLFGQDSPIPLLFVDNHEIESCGSVLQTTCKVVKAKRPSQKEGEKNQAHRSPFSKGEFSLWEDGP